MTILITFIIPVRHPKNSRDWNELKRNLSATLRSICLQDNKAWQAIIVANRHSDLPALPHQVKVKWVDFPPNYIHEQGQAKKEEFYEAVRFDKGRRVLEGMLEARETEYIMVVDDDDFVSKSLTSFVEKNRGNNGWYVKYGYVWSQGSHLLYCHSEFSKLCGTSHIIRRDLYNLPTSAEAASEIYIKVMLGSHIFIQEYLLSSETPLAPLPFFGAIYRVGHTGSHSKSRGVLGSFLFNKSLLKRPSELIRNCLRFRALTKSVKHEFFS